jgi:predicted amidophosphoribosyltransferase
VPLGPDRFFELGDVRFSSHRYLAGNLDCMHPGYCPQCGERVTPFAAGCALCGADLDPKRWQRPVPARQRLSIRLPARWRRTSNPNLKAPNSR